MFRPDPVTLRCHMIHLRVLRRSTSFQARWFMCAIFFAELFQFMWNTASNQILLSLECLRRGLLRIPLWFKTRATCNLRNRLCQRVCSLNFQRWCRGFLLDCEQTLAQEAFRSDHLSIPLLLNSTSKNLRCALHHAKVQKLSLEQDRKSNS